MFYCQFARIDFKNLNIFDKHVNNLITSLQEITGIVDLQPAFFWFTLAIITVLIFRKPIDDLKDKDHNTFANLFDYVSSISAL